METIYTTTQLDADLRALREKAKTIPTINKLRVENFFGKLLVEASRVARLKDEPQDNNALYRQIRDRHDSRKRIFAALKAGRRFTLADCKEFRCSEMCNQMHFIREDIKKNNLPWVMRDRWVHIGELKRRVKEWWLEPKEEIDNS